jgi:hypothetical protein
VSWWELVKLARKKVSQLQNGYIKGLGYPGPLSLPSIANMNKTCYNHAEYNSKSAWNKRVFMPAYYSVYKYCSKALIIFLSDKSDKKIIEKKLMNLFP